MQEKNPWIYQIESVDIYLQVIQANQREKLRLQQIVTALREILCKRRRFAVLWESSFSSIFSTENALIQFGVGFIFQQFSHTFHHENFCEIFRIITSHFVISQLV